MHRSTLLTLVFLSGFASAATIAGGVETTSRHLYRPFGPNGLAPGIRIAETVYGYCWTASISDQRPDAYRCFVGNYIPDPCFANTGGSEGFVICPTFFPGSRVIKIDLTRKLPRGNRGSNPTRHPPWVIRLSGGRWCAGLSGATGDVAGLRVSYGCKGGGVLLGEPRRHSPTWTIAYAASFTSTSYRTVNISQAWW